MPDHPSPASSRRSCTPCRALKRKCDKRKPVCSLCLRVGRDCKYPRRVASTLVQRTALSPTSIAASSSAAFDQDQLAFTTENPQEQARSCTLARIREASSINQCTLLFLDSILFRQMRLPMILPPLKWRDLGADFEEFNQSDARQICESYFKGPHTWFPVVSKMRLDRLVTSNSIHENAKDMALLHVMALFVQNLSDDEQSVRYNRLKIALAACESSAEVGTNLLAANVLTALYEITHNIYPSAYIRVAICSRLCFTLGIHNPRTATQLGLRPNTWTEVEERRRLWWASLILDRLINAGFMFRPLMCPVLDASEIVPCDDKAWDKGSMAVNPLLIMTPGSQIATSPFARLCQAAHLLGKVSQHANEHFEPTDTEMHLAEAYPIQSATSALLALLREDIRGAESDTACRLTGPFALCCSTLLSLYFLHCCIDDDHLAHANQQNRARGGHLRGQLQEMAIAGFGDVSKLVLELADYLNRFFEQGKSSQISPLTCLALYQAGKVFVWEMKETGRPEHEANMCRIRYTLEWMSLRWTCASRHVYKSFEPRLEQRMRAIVTKESAHRTNSDGWRPAKIQYDFRLQRVN